MKKPLKQGISFGTVFMLAVTLIVLVGSAAVLSKLKGDTPFNISLSGGDGVIDLKEITNLITAQEIPVEASVGSYAREENEKAQTVQETIERPGTAETESLPTQKAQVTLPPQQKGSLFQKRGNY